MKKLIFAILAIAAILFVVRVINEKKELLENDPLDLEEDDDE